MGKHDAVNLRERGGRSDCPRSNGFRLTFYLMNLTGRKPYDRIL